MYPEPEPRLEHIFAHDVDALQRALLEVHDGKAEEIRDAFLNSDSQWNKWLKALGLAKLLHNDVKDFSDEMAKCFCVAMTALWL